MTDVKSVAVAAVALMGSLCIAPASAQAAVTLNYAPSSATMINIKTGVQTLSGVFGSWSVDVQPRRVVFTDVPSTSARTLALYPFRNFVIDLHGEKVTSVTVDSASTLKPAAAFYSAGKLYVSFKGISPGRTIIDIAAVPEPATWSMMLLGFFGLGAVKRRARALEA